MFSKAFTTLSLILALSVHVNGHTLIVPALGVKGAGARSDVQRAGNGCGNVNAAQAIGASTPVAAAADGTFTVTATDFNAGADGSRSVSATVDATGAGKTFAGQVKITKNGDAAPKAVGSDQIVGSLPAGTKCAGGASKNLCLVAFKTTAGFGNCVVVSQGAAAAGSANGNAAAGTANGNAAAGNANGNAAAGNANKKNGNGRFNNGFNGRPAGTRSARALLAELEARGEETLEVVKRNIVELWA